jgi:hypothetical protein
MIKHSQAPWSHHPYDNIILTHDGRKLFEWIAKSSRVLGKEVSVAQRDANACLVAAAPDLLEALELAVRQNSHDMLLTGDELRTCEAALAKARGTE